MFTPQQLKDGIRNFSTFMSSMTRSWSERAIHGNLPILIPPPQPEPTGKEWTHFHARPEVFFQLRGHNHFAMQESDMMAQQGSFSIIPRLIAHRETRHKHRGYYAHVCMTITTESVSCHLAGLPPLSSNRYHMALVALRRSSPKAAFMSSLVEEMIHCSLNERSEQRLSLLGVLLLQYLSEAFEESSSQNLSSLVHDAQRIAMRRLHDSSLSVEEIALRLSCHPDHLSRTYRETTGQTLRSFIILHRMLLAEELLRTTRIPVIEVAQLTGYTDHAYFSARFKEHAARTPSEFRELAKDQSASI